MVAAPQLGFIMQFSGVCVMVKYEYASKVVQQVRWLLRSDKRLSVLLATNPMVKLDVDFCLDSVVWTYYDLQLIVTKTHVVYGERVSKRDVVLSYESFDELLKMK